MKQYPWVVGALSGLVMLGGPVLAQAAPEVSHQYVAEALKSLIDSEKDNYDKLIAKRSAVHGCKTGTDLKNNTALIPTTEYFQNLVSTAFRAHENGKYAQVLSPDFGKKEGKMAADKAADTLNAYAMLSRKIYTTSVVARAKVSKCSEALEEWAEEKGLPLPAQFTRAVADGVRQRNKFTYSLQSEWPINKQNVAKTDFEKKAIKATQNGKPIYTEETVAGKKYFAGAYADVAVDKTCVTCHNEHTDSPKKDFKLNDVMGDMVVRIPLQ